MRFQTMLVSLKKPFLFALCILPIAIVAGICVAYYQLTILPEAVLQQIHAKLSDQELILVATLQTICYSVLSAFFGYILANKVSLLKPLTFNRSALTTTGITSVSLGILFSLDYWVFGKFIPEILQSGAKGVTALEFIASVLYGGIIEELMLRFFMMSLLAFILWKVFCRREQTPPTWVLICANVIAAILFAAGHLPATIQVFGTLTPMILFRCFLLNGAFGLFFGRLYRQYGIAYAMMAHATLHIVSKVIWIIFI